MQQCCPGRKARDSEKTRTDRGLFSQPAVVSVTVLAYSTLAIAATTASMFFGFSAATQMRPESTA